MFAKKKQIFIAVLISIVDVVFICAVISNRQKMKGGDILEEDLSYFREFAEEIDASELEIFEYEEAYGTDLGEHEFTIDFDRRVYLIDEISIHSVESAIEVGRGIIRTYHESGKWCDWTLVSVGHYKSDNAWEFIYSMDQRNVPALELVDGGIGVYVVDGDTGEILDAWIEE